MTSLEDQQALLLYRVGPVLCCAPSLSVLSIIQPVPLTHPPGTDPARPGIFRYSGRVIKTEDLRVRFGVDEADHRPGRLIIVEVDSGPTAFWVDDIIDVIAMPRGGWGQPPSHLPRGIFSRTLLLNEKIYLYAEFDALQKLQGHGLLKTYIDTLLAESQPPAVSEISAPVATAPVQDTSELTPQTQAVKAAPSPAKTIPSTTASSSLKNNATVEPASGAKTRPLKKTPLPETAPIAKPGMGAAVNTHKPAPVSNRKTTSTFSAPAARRTTTTAITSSATPLAKTIEPLSAGADANGQKPAPAQSSSPFTALFIGLLLLAAIGGGLYYYFLATPQTITVSKTSTDIPDVYQMPEPETPPEPDVTPGPPPVASTPVVPEKPHDVVAIPVEATAPPATTTVAAASDSTYQARIDQDAEGITIVIKAPPDESVLKENAAEEPTRPAPTTADTPTETAPEVTVPAIKKAPPSKTKAPHRQEILHIVVKGDTLWGIAKRYVNNPFRYPELARLSNIKNPDLIYPGNRVRIIREFN